MATEIRIYVEGGGKGNPRARIRKAFNAFFASLVATARESGIRWELIPCGSRNSTLEDFKTALRSHPDAFNVLLVDADGPMRGSKPKQHLHNPNHGWDLQVVSDEQCHLMVQIFEAWLVADVEALEAFFSPGFNARRLPKHPKVEEIDKAVLEKALKEATRKSKKGEYHKIKHAAKLLELIDASKVRSAAPHCRRLFETLEAKLAE
jgi:hypothetical protein